MSYGKLHSFSSANGRCSFVVCLFADFRIMKNPIGNERMKEISDAIHEGAMAF